MGSTEKRAVSQRPDTQEMEEQVFVGVRPEFQGFVEEWGQKLGRTLAASLTDLKVLNI